MERHQRCFDMELKEAGRYSLYAYQIQTALQIDPILIHFFHIVRSMCSRTETQKYLTLNSNSCSHGSVHIFMLLYPAIRFMLSSHDRQLS